MARWDELVEANPDGGHSLQTRAWGEFKATRGWRPRYLIHEGTRGRVAVLFLSRRVPFLGSLWYSPKGPGVTEAAALLDVLEERSTFAGAFLVKVEPELAPEDVDLEELRRADIRKAPGDVQISAATIIVDLRPAEEDIIASFKPKCRYNIRLAARKGVQVRRMPISDETIDVMYRLMSSTQARQRFVLRQRSYFAGYWQLQHACRQGELFFAFLGDEVLAGVFVSLLGNRAWYKDGGSVKRHSELMAPHLLQWEVMRWLKNQGVESYDLVAVPRRAELRPEHPLYGLYRFKSGFCDDIT
ncbi:MAG TPA: peptidoglycan bridge formation glycyltransferase FemA/FemB family protein, partial [Candidatus Sulfotelmatobacter sp.]|nr:peptidoglycan bridge formation glycyltransferase FemA/FemB family protein [Candidatus Sulfotelmatobacter sp.]